MPEGRFFESVVDQMVGVPKKPTTAGYTPPPPYGSVGVANAPSVLLWRLDGKYKADQEQFDKDLRAWAAGDRREPAPVMPSPPFGVLQEYLEEASGLQCEIRPPNDGQPARVSFIKEAEFDENSLSAGEKQALLLALFRRQLDVDPFIFLVDEPEIHLNASRADELWSSIERSLPNVVFIYATHDPIFASRPSVTRNYLMDASGEIEKVDRESGMPHAAVSALLGARVQIMRKAAPTIFCEDKLLRVVVSDLMKDADVNVIPLNGCDSVAKAVKGEALWKSARSPGMTYCGAIDRDARDDAEVADFDRKRIVCFPLFEAESLLIDKDVGTWLLSVMAERTVSTAEYLEVVRTAAINSLHRTLEAIRDHISESFRATVEFRLSSNKVALEQCEAIQPRKEELEREFQRRVNQLTAAIEGNDIASIAKLFDGKALFERVAGIAKLGITDPEKMYLMIRDKPDFIRIRDGLDWVVDFREKLLSHLR